jgi:hypothetical protein
MSTTTFTVTVVSTGGGNKYFIDGVQQATVNLAANATYRFDQSDSSNGTGVGHPLLLSTTSDGTHSGGSVYNTGVTTNGTPGSPGAYTEIVVAADAPNLYYFCQYHPGMGGSAPVTDDSWGALAWNVNSWGNQDEAIVSLTGLSATSSVGTPEAFNETGWGADGWGAEGWGGAESLIPMPAFSLTATVNLPGDNVAVTPGWGTETWGQNGWGNVELAVEPLSGLSATTTLGSIGDIPDVSLGISGQSATTTLGSPSIVVDCSLTLPNQSLTANLGGPNGVIVEILPAQSLTATLGNPTYSMQVPVSLSGLSATSAVGSPEITSNPSVLLSALSATSSLGSLNVTIGELLPALSATSAVGVPSVSTATIATMPAQSLTSTLNGSKINLFYVNELTPNTSANYTGKNYNTSATYTIKKYHNQP